MTKCLIILNFSFLSAVATAQHYPTKPIRMVVGFAAGGAPTNTAVLAGEAQVYFSGMPPALPLVQAGRLRALAQLMRQEVEK